MGITTGQCAILEAMAEAGVGTTREKGGAVAERKDREILTILSRWRQKGREGELWSLSPVTTVQALHPSSAVMCHGTCVVALCVTGMTAGISPRASVLLLPHAKHSPPTSSIPFAGPSNFLPVGELTVSSGSCKQTSQTSWSESGDLGPRPDPDHQT